MLRNLLVGLGLILGLTLGAPPVEAAPITLTVVTACGTPPTTYTVGQAFPGTQDTTGKLCDTGSGGGGGGGTSSAFNATFPEDGTAAGFLNSSSGNMVPAVVDNSTGGVNVNIVGGGGSGGTSSADEGAFTAGSTALTIGGGFFQTTATSNALTNGQSGAFQLTAQRALFVNLRNASGAEAGVAAVPLQVSVANTSANGTAILVTGTGGTFPLPANQSVNVSQVGGTNTLSGGTAGSLGIGGLAADAASTSGNPVPAGAVYESAPPTYTAGQRSTLHTGTRGALWTQIMGPDGTTPVAVSSSGADGKSNSTAGLNTYTFPSLYNGSTWDRTPGTTNGAYSIIRDAAGNARGANVTAASTSAALTDPALVVSLSPNPDNVCTGKTPISQTTSTDVKTFTNVGYICSIILVSATAQNISVIEGTGTVCATGTTAVIGGTSASMAVGVNGGFSAVSDRPWVQLEASADHVCVLQSGSGNVSGVITWQDHT